MSDQTDTLGGRLPLADPATLNPAQREIFDRMATRIVPWANDAQFQSTAEDGRLLGPFNPALLNPAIAAPFLDLQFAEQVHTSLSARVREVVILTVGAVWQADLHVPPNVPAKQYWSVIAYDAETNGFIRESPVVGLDSYNQAMQRNTDGSIDLYFGPEAATGKESNWINTTRGRPWFPGFRLYNPDTAFFDKLWVLPDLEQLK